MSGSGIGEAVVSNDQPVILVVEQESGNLHFIRRLLETRYRVLTCPVEAVGLEFVSESRPAAVLLDADAFYLEGSGLVERWRSASPGTRVVFVDTDGPWALLMEPDGTEPGQVSIHPCALDEIGSAVDELLGRRGAGTKECCDDRMAFLAV
jgi:DNA-binding NtrC family response regulator